MRRCKQCDAILLKKIARYCSNKCQANYQYYTYIKNWKKGAADGSRGVNAKAISKHVRRYLLEKYDNICCLCGWGEINITSQASPLEVDHLDGNSENNEESNLRLLCPNCHSLTPNFRNLNVGKGRAWRRLKYLKM